jgi:hypothetical protein
VRRTRGRCDPPWNDSAQLLEPSLLCRAEVIARCCSRTRRKTSYGLAVSIDRALLEPQRWKQAASAEGSTPRCWHLARGEGGGRMTCLLGEKANVRHYEPQAEESERPEPARNRQSRAAAITAGRQGSQAQGNDGE